MGKILDQYVSRKVLGRWRKAAQSAPFTALHLLRRQRDEARQFRLHLERLIQVADGRLTRPLIGSTSFPKPLGTDWAWRPDLWRGPLAKHGHASLSRKTSMDKQVTLFHDCDLGEIAIRQTRNTADKDLAPFSLALEIFEFTGSFLSLSIELPAEATFGLTRQHLIRASAQIECERPTGMFARLNIQHGPNTEQVLRELSYSDSSMSVDFDLAHLHLNERRVEKIWLDLIINDPRMNRIVLRDLTLCRHHRADL
ncbi:DUF6478 family protein [Roseibium sp. RKSG952]|uniref:DUF6478 family protein n=1 Tax=Roseibium sp. RKSG952 TaxID=2529384 RepID=UPI0012BB9906|nr:DUF6478 family protein [Roseibium sp. RKSG952]MTI00823.1 hypothetical protein [Roseibium sp. RKSG952]